MTDPVRESAAAPELVTVRLDGAQHRVPYRRGETLLQAAQRAGIDPPFACEEGYCGSCQARLLRGRVAMLDPQCLAPEDIAAGEILACQSLPLTDEIEIDWDP